MSPDFDEVARSNNAAGLSAADLRLDSSEPYHHHCDGMVAVDGSWMCGECGVYHPGSRAAVRPTGQEQADG